MEERKFIVWSKNISLVVWKTGPLHLVENDFREILEGSAEYNSNFKLNLNIFLSFLMKISFPYHTLFSENLFKIKRIYLSLKESISMTL